MVERKPAVLTVRIVGGRLGGRHLKAPRGVTTRPTAERVREAIASVLLARDAISGRLALDLYAGSGALGFEVLSRGAARVVFVEKSPGVARQLLASAADLGVRDQVEVITGDVTRPKTQDQVLGRAPFSLVMADPPYRDAAAAVHILASLCARGLVAPDAHLLLETSSKEAPALPNALAVVSKYRYGDTAVTLCVHREV